MPRQEETWIAESDQDTSDTAGSGRGQRLLGRKKRGRTFAAIVAILLGTFITLVGFTMHAAFSGSNGRALALSNALTPLGFGILLVLAIMAFFGDRNLD